MTRKPFLADQRLEGASALFYAPVVVSGQLTLSGVLDSGSMSCSEEGTLRLKAAGVQLAPSNDVLISCGGLTTT